MATYVVGDLQGCLPDLLRLLDKLNFSDTDQLWLTGDLVNRGPDSLGSLRFVKGLGAQARTVLGNHDLHLLATYYGNQAPKRKDTFDEILAASDCAELMNWLVQQPLVIHEPAFDVYMSHAGLYPGWTPAQALLLSNEVEAVLHDPSARLNFFAEMYGAEPAYWDEKLTGIERLRFITNALTRMRLVSSEAPYALDMQFKEELTDVPESLSPWFAKAELAAGARWLFGHWAALNAQTNHSQFIALDSGCVWGRFLTSYCIETGQIVTSR